MCRLLVNNVPKHMQIPFQAFGYTGAAVFYSFFATLRRTCRWEEVMPPNGAFSGPRIDCVWHEHLPTYISRYVPPPSGKPCRKLVWMQHPAWYMHPVHIALRWGGVQKKVLGSTGHGGQAALEEMVNILKTGEYSTMVAVDGPAGPPHEVKRGALDLSLLTGLPCVAIHCRYDWSIRSPTGWDGKHCPIPLTRVKVVESEPIWVTRENYEESREILVENLG